MTAPDHPLARQARRLVLIGAFVVLGCTLIGAAAAVEVALAYTKPHAPKGTPPHA